MDETKFNRMIYAIAVGLYEKEQSTEKYPYSNHLMYGLNILAAFAARYHQFKMLADLHEAAFLEKYANRPIMEWFNGWDNSFLKTLGGFPLFQTGALISLDESRSFHVTEECYDLLGDTENDLFNALEQSMVYQKMKELSEEDYIAVRRSIIENPICTLNDLQRFKMKHSSQEISKIIEMSYEDIPIGSYQCKECGWTMQFHGDQPICCNRSCTVHHPTPEQLISLDKSGKLRLKHGVMRYICLPGKLELVIQERAEKYGCKTRLWPDKDRYDIQIILPNGSTWAVDAKMYRNPYTLASAIKDDGAFETVSADQKFYVVPAKVSQDSPAYCDICNDALKGKTASCITDKELYRMLREVKKNG